MAFKGIPATDDLRGSMSIKVLDALRKAHPDAEFRLFDPVIERRRCWPRSSQMSARRGRIGDAVSGASVVVIANNHPMLGSISPRTLTEFIGPDGFVFDYWNHFSHLPTAELGDSYFAVGKSGLVPSDG